MRATSRASLAGLITLAFVVLACDNTPTQTKPTPLPCSYGVSTGSLSFAVSGGSASITVTAAAECQWTAVSDSDWISIDSGGNGAGNGVVAIKVAANPTAAERTGTLTIGGQTISVRVAPGAAESCAIDISPTEADFGPDAATGRLTVTAPAQCQWSAHSTEPWLSIMTASSGSGTGTIAFALDQNSGALSRTGAIAIGDRLFVVTQSGNHAACEYSVTPIEMPVCMSVPSELTASITTAPGCPWTADTGSAWITLRTPSPGAGPAAIRLTVSDNWDAPRQGLLMIRWPLPTAGQNVRVSQGGCRYSVSVTDMIVDAAGGARTFDVLQQSDPLECGGALQDGCAWTAQSTAPWITISSPATQRGDQRVSLVVAANPAAAPRTGVITVRDKAVTVTQAGR